MSIEKVLQLGDPLLREVCTPVKDPGSEVARDLLQDLSDTVKYWRETTGYGRAIAAPQLGVLKRVILLQLPGREPWPLINPEIVSRSGRKIAVWDACLSFLFLFMKVERYAEVTVRYQNTAGAWLTVTAGADDDLAELLQHEIDHLDGILATDRVTDIKTFCSREEFEKRYRNASPYGQEKR